MSSSNCIIDFENNEDILTNDFSKEYSYSKIIDSPNEPSLDGKLQLNRLVGYTSLVLTGRKSDPVIKEDKTFGDVKLLKTLRKCGMCRENKNEKSYGECNPANPTAYKVIDNRPEIVKNGPENRGGGFLTGVFENIGRANPGKLISSIPGPSDIFQIKGITITTNPNQSINNLLEENNTKCTRIPRESLCDDLKDGKYYAIDTPLPGYNDVETKETFTNIMTSTNEFLNNIFYLMIICIVIILIFKVSVMNFKYCKNIKFKTIFID
tara:strand:- start:26955 stop:27752 length:798 start_codon:yes stop_codon:yes gene_type:complete